MNFAKHVPDIAQQRTEVKLIQQTCKAEQCQQ